MSSNMEIRLGDLVDHDEIVVELQETVTQRRGDKPDLAHVKFGIATFVKAEFTFGLYREADTNEAILTRDIGGMFRDTPHPNDDHKQLFAMLHRYSIPFKIFP